MVVSGSWSDLNDVIETGSCMDAVCIDTGSDVDDNDDDIDWEDSTISENEKKKAPMRSAVLAVNVNFMVQCSRSC